MRAVVDFVGAVALVAGSTEKNRLESYPRGRQMLRVIVVLRLHRVDLRRSEDAEQDEACNLFIAAFPFFRLSRQGGCAQSPLRIGQRVAALNEGEMCAMIFSTRSQLHCWEKEALTCQSNVQRY